jgi:hypothetical protein
MLWLALQGVRCNSRCAVLLCRGLLGAAYKYSEVPAHGYALGLYSSAECPVVLHTFLRLAYRLASNVFCFDISKALHLWAALTHLPFQTKQEQAACRNCRQLASCAMYRLFLREPFTWCTCTKHCGKRAAVGCLTCDCACCGFARMPEQHQPVAAYC